MLVIKNYKKLEGLMFGEWKCGLAEEHDPLYRFSFHKGGYNANGRWKQTYWIEIERNVFTDSDGDRVVKLNFPRRKVETQMSMGYMRELDNIIQNFTEIIKTHAKD